MLIAINGPMGAGKSYELIKFVHGYEAQGKKVICVKPKIDTRNDGIWSRAGIKLEALNVDSLSEVPSADVIVVDEAHFFDASEVEYIEKWLETSDVILSGLDVGHQRELMPFFSAIYALKPDMLLAKTASCSVCHNFNAHYTQILKDGVVITEDFDEPPVEDGTYQYEPRCRRCFVR